MADLLGIDRRTEKRNKQYQKLQQGIIPSGSEYRLRRMNGELLDSNGNKSQFNQEKYRFFLDAPFEISSKCCDIMKKLPAHEYEKTTGRKPILGVMASESIMRTQKWLQEGCNAFDVTRPNSKPIAFWTEQDVLFYIKEHSKEMIKARLDRKGYMFYGDRIVSKETGATVKNKNYYIPIASVYGDIVTDYGTMGQVENQMNIADFGIFDLERPLLKTTGCDRTGCMFCGYGCHLEKSPNRFERMKETHPKQYEYIMKPVDKGGLGYKDVIDWINEHGNINIKY